MLFGVNRIVGFLIFSTLFMFSVSNLVILASPSYAILPMEIVIFTLKRLGENHAPL